MIGVIANAIIGIAKSSCWGGGGDFVRVDYGVSTLVVAMECAEEVVGAYRGVNEDVAIECGA